MKRQVLFLLIGCFVVSVPGRAQAPITRVAAKVTLDLSKGPVGANESSTYIGYLEQGMPFEKKFFLHVNMAAADTAVMAADFGYRLDEKGFDCSKNSRSSLILPDFCADSPAVSSFTNKGFDVEIKGVHPNKKYHFNFTFYTGLTAKQQQSLKAGIAAKILQFFQLRGAHFDRVAIDRDLTPHIQEAITVAMGQAILKNTAHQTVSAHDLAISIMGSQAVADMITAQEMFDHKNDILAGFIGDIDHQMGAPWFHQLLVDLPSWTWDDGGKALLAAPLSDTGELKDLSAQTIIAPLLELTDAAKRDDLLNGQKSFHDGFFLKKEHSTDLVFIAGVRKALVRIRRSLSFVRGPRPTAAEKATLDAELETTIEKLSDFIQYFTDHQYGIFEKPVDANYVTAKLPDALVNFVIATNVTVAESTQLEDITTNNSAYISLDAGVGYVSGLYSGFTYYGVNFYPVPIDKTIPLKTYNARPLLRLLKSTCLSVGVTTNYFNNGNESKRYSSLLGGGKDVFTGIGFRLTRVFKVNAGADWSYLNDENPLSNKRILNAKLAVGLSLDINIIKAFSSLANAIGLSN